MKGPSDIDIAVVEEGEDIRSKEMFDTFVDGLRKDGCIVIIMLNTPSLQHFIVQRLFTAETVHIDGKPIDYFKLIPRDDIPGFICIQTDYTMNPFLTDNIIARYKGYGDPKHHLFDLHHYFTAILGYSSTGRKGQIFTKVQKISLKEYHSLRLIEVFGQDWGTASPAALVGCKFDGNTVYIRLLNYKPLDILEIGKLYCTLGLSPSDRIVCDYAEPESIKKVKSGFKNLDAHEYETYPALARGWNAVKCPPKDIPARLSLMKSMRIFCVSEHTELWNEVYNFCYEENKFGNYVDKPLDEFNHALFDAAGYVIDDQRGKSKMYGV